MYTGKISLKHEHKKRQQYLFIEHVNSNYDIIQLFTADWQYHNVVNVMCSSGTYLYLSLSAQHNLTNNFQSTSQSTFCSHCAVQSGDTLHLPTLLKKLTSIHFASCTPLRRLHVSF